MVSCTLKSLQKTCDNCVTLGGHLASIGDQAEQDFVYNMVLVAHGTPGTAYFIGLMQMAGSSDLSGVSMWSDGTPYDYAQWSNWEPAGPPAMSGAASCITIIAPGSSDAGKWRARVCTLQPSYICEMAATPAG